MEQRSGSIRQVSAAHHTCFLSGKVESRYGTHPQSKIPPQPGLCITKLPADQEGAGISLKSLIQSAATSLLLFAASTAAQTGPLASANIYTYAGTGTGGYSGDGGLAVNAELNLPHGVVSDAAGNIYYADGNENVVRKIVRATNVITTVAGTGTAGYDGDGGPATAAELNNPYDVALDSAGNLYIADAWNACVRRVDAHTGVISTYAGICTVLGETGNNGPATQATVILPLGVAMDPAGNLFITDAGLSLVHEVSAATGIMTIFAGKIDATQLGDGGPATEAQIEYAIGIATDPAGNVFIVDSNANRVRKVTVATGIITTVAGTGVFGYGADGILATESQLAQPNDVTTDAVGNIYFSDSAYGRVRRIDATTGIISTVAGIGGSGFSGDGGPAIDAQMEYPEGLWFDAANNLYIADSFNNRIRVVGTPPDTSPISTTTRLSASAATLNVDQTLTLTAAVTAVSGSVPAGAVTFYDGPAAVGSGTLNAGGTATLDWTPGTVGNHAVTATYPGSTTDAASTSAPPIIVTVTGSLIATTTALTASASSLTAGQTLTLTATVTPASGVAPAGTVSFLSGTASLGSASLNSSGVATLMVTPAAGSYSITASYGGSSIDEPSVSAAVPVTVTSGGSPFIYQYAGNGNFGSGGDGCSAANAHLDPVFSLASDAAGNLYIADFESNRIRRIDHATGIITTYAGSGTPGFSGDNGPATSAQLDAPYGITLDAAGNLYIADFYNYRIRKVDAATGMITTVAGDGTHGSGGDKGQATSAEIGEVYGVATDTAGNLYIGDDSNFRIRKVNAATGIITTVAGNGTPGYGGDGGPATSAEFFGLLDLALDQAGNIYISDTENVRVRKVDAATGIITTIAGNGVQGYGGDGGPGTSAELDQPEAIASDAAGNVTFADIFNNRVRRVDAATGVITTVAGDGTQGFGPMDGPAIDSALNEPAAVALDAAGDIFIDVNGVTQILVVGAQPNFPLIATATSLVAAPTALLAGQPLTLTATVTASACTTPAGTVSFYNGAALLGTASLNGSGVATLGLNPAAGNYSLTASYGGSSIDAPSQSAPPVLVTVNGILISTTTTLNAVPTTLSFGQSLTLTASVSAVSGGTPTGTVTFYNGSALLGSGTLSATGGATLQLTPAVGSFSITASYGGNSVDAPSVSTPVAVVVSPATAYSPDIYTIAGDGIGGYGGDGVLATSAELNSPWDPTVDAAGNLYIADTANNRIRKVDATTGIISTVAGNGHFGYGGDGGPATSAEIAYPYGVTADAAGNLYIADNGNNRVRRVDASTGIIATVAGDGTFAFSGDGGPATKAGVKNPVSIALDALGDMYISEPDDSRIRKVEAATGIIATVAGDGVFGYSGDGGPATSAEMEAPWEIALDASGNLYIADWDDHCVRKVDAATGIIGTVAGNGIAGASGDGGPATSAEFYYPYGLALDASANIYISDEFDSRVRVVNAATGIITAFAGDGTAGFGGDAGPAIDAELSDPAGLAVDAKGNLYIADYANNRIRIVGQKPRYSSVPTTTSLTAVPATLAVGQTLTLTATVTAAAGPTPGGTVTFHLTGPDSVPQLSATLNTSGVASVTLSALPVGVYHVYAAYTGSSNDAPSNSSPPLTVNVTLPATTTSLSASPNPAAFGASVTFTATVSNATSTPTGTVSFYNGTALLGTKTLLSGVADLSTSTLSAGSHGISAVYTPTPAFSPSKSSVLVEVISIDSFSIAASPGSRAVYTGEAASFTVKLTPASGFTLPVALSCSQLPANTTCTFSPASVSGSSGSSTLTVQTTAPSPSKTTSASLRVSRITALAALLLFFIPRRMGRNRRAWNAVVALVAFLAVAGAVTGCSGGGSLSGGTPAGSHSLTLTGTATNGVDTLSQNTTVTLQVNSLF